MGALQRRVDAHPDAERRGAREGDSDEVLHRGRFELLTLRRPHRPIEWRVSGGVLSDADHTLIMGVVNVTPDSFSDGGHFFDPADAIRHGTALAEAGADILDIGGESTRPGADPVGVDEELERVLPVIEALAELSVPLSIDTSKAAVAAAALEAGAAIVNDVTALGDPEMAQVVARHRAGVVLMHMLGEPRTMQVDPSYDDVVEDVSASLEDAAARAVAAGVDERSICLDPGIGFGKTLSHNLDLLTLGVERLCRIGYPVLVGASRKSFLTGILGDLDPLDRDVPTVAAHTLAIAAGASIIRSHNVVAALRSARVADAIVRGE